MVHNRNVEEGVQSDEKKCELFGQYAKLTAYTFSYHSGGIGIVWGNAFLQHRQIKWLDLSER